MREISCFISKNTTNNLDLKKLIIINFSLAEQRTIRKTNKFLVVFFDAYHNLLKTIQKERIIFWQASKSLF